MLGWSVHGLYIGLEDELIQDESHQHTAAIFLLVAVITTIVVCSLYAALTSGRRRRRWRCCGRHEARRKEETRAQTAAKAAAALMARGDEIPEADYAAQRDLWAELRARKEVASRGASEAEPESGSTPVPTSSRGSAYEVQYASLFAAERGALSNEAEEISPRSGLSPSEASSSFPSSRGKHVEMRALERQKSAEVRGASLRSSSNIRAADGQAMIGSISPRGQPRGAEAATEAIAVDALVRGEASPTVYRDASGDSLSSLDGSIDNARRPRSPSVRSFSTRSVSMAASAAARDIAVMVERDEGKRGDKAPDPRPAA